MTDPKTWKVGDKCWVDDHGARRGEVILSQCRGGLVSVRTPRSAWHYAPEDLFADRADLRLALAKDAVSEARHDEAMAKVYLRDANREVSSCERDLARATKKRERAQARLAALKAVGS